MNPPDRIDASPDGAFRFEFQEEHGRMSHTINSPRLVEVATGRVLFDMTGTYWDLAVRNWTGDSVQVALRYYYYDSMFSVVIRLTGALASIDNGEFFPAGELHSRLDAIIAGKRAASLKKDRLDTGWKVGLALLAIGIAGWLARHWWMDR